MLLTTLILNLASNSITLRTDKSICYSRIVIICLIISSLLSYVSFYSNLLGTGIGIYGGLFFISSITNIFHIFIYILTSVILIFTGFYAKKFINNDDSINTIFLSKKKYYHIKILNIKSEIYKILEYPLIILFILNGALFLICANDLVSIFISIELQSYGLYLISSIHKNSESSTAGGLMYFLLGGLSSCFILLGTSLLYSNSGTTNLDNLYIINNISNFVYLPLDNSKYLENYIYSFSNVSTYSNYYIIISLVIMGVGLLFKVSAAPFHFWSPDVYDAIPTIVTSFVAIIAKISIFILLLELVHYLSKSSINYVWTNNLLISSLLSLIIGSVLGLTQFRIKRLYAYSTISHIGFILLALSINTLESIQAFMFYLIQYSISNLNAFIILISIGYLYYNSDLNDNVNNTINNKNEEEININNTVNKDDNHEENINIKNKEDNDKLEEYFDDIAHGTYKQKDEMVRYHVRRLKRSLGWEIHEKDKYGYNEKNNNEKDKNKKDNNEKGNLVNSNEKNNPVDNKEKNNITDKNQKDNLLSYTFDDTNEKDNLLEKENSPIQVISQLNGYFNSNPLLTLSLSITLFSFAGIPPLIGFFGKMMVLSAAIDIGYIFMALVAILTSVISAVYYLFIIKESYFNNTSFISENNVKNTNYVVLSNYLSISISILTLFILLFILFPDQLINITSILVLILFNV